MKVHVLGFTLTVKSQDRHLSHHRTTWHSHKGTIALRTKILDEKKADEQKRVAAHKKKAEKERKRAHFLDGKKVHHSKISKELRDKYHIALGDADSKCENCIGWYSAWAFGDLDTSKMMWNTPDRKDAERQRWYCGQPDCQTERKEEEIKVKAEHKRAQAAAVRKKQQDKKEKKKKAVPKKSSPRAQKRKTVGKPKSAGAKGAHQEGPARKRRKKG